MDSSDDESDLAAKRSPSAASGHSTAGAASKTMPFESYKGTRTFSSLASGASSSKSTQYRPDEEHSRSNRTHQRRLQSGDGSDIQLRLLQDRINSQENVIASLSDAVSDLAQRIEVLESLLSSSRIASPASLPHKGERRDYAGSETPMNRHGRSVSRLSFTTPPADERPSFDQEASSRLQNRQTRKRSLPSEPTEPFYPFSEHLECEHSATPRLPQVEKCLPATSKDSPFQSQEVQRLRYKAFTWLNVNVPQLHGEVGVVATLLEPNEDRQLSRFVPGNRMSQSMFDSMCKAERLGFKMERFRAEPRLGNFEMCAIQVRLSVVSGAKAMYRRMAFAILPDDQVISHIEIVRCDREDGLPDADFAFKYVLSEQGKPRIMPLNTKLEGVQALAHGKLALERAQASSLMSGSDYATRPSKYQRR